MRDQMGMRDQLKKAFTHAVTSYGIDPTQENYGRVLRAVEAWIAFSVAAASEEHEKDDGAALLPVDPISEVTTEALPRNERSK